MNYKEKVTEFWNWFLKEQDHLCGLMKEKKKDEINSLLKEQLSRILCGYYFETYELNGKYNLELIPMGDSLNRIIMKYITDNVPNALKMHWNFFSCRMPKKGSISVKGMTLSGDDIKAIPIYNSKSGKFHLKVFCPLLKDWNDKDKFGVTYLMLYEYIGEAMCEAYIDDIEYPKTLSCKLRYKDMKQYSFTNLEDYLKKQIDINKVNPYLHSGLIYEWYTKKVSKNINPQRYDIKRGYSALTDLVAEYYENESLIKTRLIQMGVTPVYISLSKIEKNKADKIMRNMVTLLGDDGILVGYAEGKLRSYFDILVTGDGEKSNLENLCSKLKLDCAKINYF